MKKPRRAFNPFMPMAGLALLIGCGEDAVSIEGLCPDLDAPYDLRKVSGKPNPDAVRKSCVTGIGTAPTQPPSNTGGRSGTGGASTLPEAGSADGAVTDTGAG